MVPAKNDQPWPHPYRGDIGLLLIATRTVRLMRRQYHMWSYEVTVSHVSVLSALEYHLGVLEQHGVGLHRHVRHLGRPDGSGRPGV